MSIRKFVVFKRFSPSNPPPRCKGNGSSIPLPLHEKKYNDGGPALRVTLRERKEQTLRLY